MRHDLDLKLLIHIWNRLTAHQRRLIILKARLYKFEQQFYLAIIYTTIFILKFLTPIPRRVQPKKFHWL